MGQPFECNDSCYKKTCGAAKRCLMYTVNIDTCAHLNSFFLMIVTAVVMTVLLMYTRSIMILYWPAQRYAEERRVIDISAILAWSYSDNYEIKN